MRTVRADEPSVDVVLLNNSLKMRRKAGKTSGRWVLYNFNQISKQIWRQTKFTNNVLEDLVRLSVLQHNRTKQRVIRVFKIETNHKNGRLKRNANIEQGLDDMRGKVTSSLGSPGELII